jgi:hypothetical protein
MSTCRGNRRSKRARATHGGWTACAARPRSRRNIPSRDQARDRHDLLGSEVLCAAHLHLRELEARQVLQALHHPAMHRHGHGHEGREGRHLQGHPTGLGRQERAGLPIASARRASLGGRRPGAPLGAPRAIEQTGRGVRWIPRVHRRGPKTDLRRRGPRVPAEPRRPTRRGGRRSWRRRGDPRRAERRNRLPRDRAERGRGLDLHVPRAGARDSHAPGRGRGPQSAQQNATGALAVSVPGGGPTEREGVDFPRATPTARGSGGPQRCPLRVPPQGREEPLLFGRGPHEPVMVARRKPWTPLS